MQGFFALIGASLLLALVLFAAQPDPPAAIVELSSGGLGDWSHGVECEIKNLEQLRKSAIVYTWVNGTERCYNERRRRAGLTPGGSSRDKEMGELKYSLRSLLKFAPWLEGPIYIVTPGQIPDWLDTSNPRITVIDQDDLLPRDKTTMPNFDTNVIEQYLYKIPGLTDIFIHMNDDYLFVKPITPHRFFTCDGGIRFLTEVNHIRHVKGTQDNAWLASVRNTVELADKVYGGTHVYNFLKHAPFVYSRQAFEQIHERFGVELDATLVHQIRHYQDLNVPLLHHIYMNEEGSKLLNIPVQFNPIAECDDWLLVRIADDNHEALKEQFDKALRGTGSEVLLALNDEYDNADTASIVREFYQALLPTPEFYELPSSQRRTIVSNHHGPECSFDRGIIPYPSASPSSAFRQRFVESIRHVSQQEAHFTAMGHTPGAMSGVTFLAYIVGLGLAVVASVCIFRATNAEIFSGGHAGKRT